MVHVPCPSASSNPDPYYYYTSFSSSRYSFRSFSRGGGSQRWKRSASAVGSVFRSNVCWSMMFRLLNGFRIICICCCCDGAPPPPSRLSAPASPYFRSNIFKFKKLNSCLGVHVKKLKLKLNFMLEFKCIKNISVSLNLSSCLSLSRTKTQLKLS